jgi:hypothetical protein
VVDVAPIAAGAGCHYPNPADHHLVACELHEFGDFYPVLGDRVDRILPLPAMDVRVYGGTGDDVLIAAHAMLMGEAGDDILVSERADGGPGNDRTGVRHGLGGDGNDRISGYQDPAEESHLYGGPDADTIYGNGGDDLLVGGPGRDVLSGGPGRDVVRQ